MKIITYSLAFTMFLLAFTIGHAQDNDSSSQQQQLEEQLEAIADQEKNALKEEVKLINEQLENKDITEAQAEVLKKEAAEKRARNIEDRRAIVQKQLDILERNGTLSTTSSKFDVVIFTDGEVLDFNFEPRHRKYDRRTTSDLVLAFGLNNVVTEGESFNDSDYKVGGSRFFELGIAWKTRVFKNSNWLRFKYGFSFQWNGLKATDDRLQVDTGTETELQDFGSSLDKSKFRLDNLVFPMHFEFGPSKKIEGDNYFRYSTRKKLKVGLGGYFGFNLGTMQKLKYRDANGIDVKEKQKASFNTNNFIYGLSAYIGWTGTALYVKYDLNPIFKDNPVEQRNISLGLRFDMD